LSDYDLLGYDLGRGLVLLGVLVLSM